MRNTLLFCISAVLLSLLFSNNLSAQTELSGTITDENTGEPLAFVYVLLKRNQSRGVLSNDLGEFNITLTAEELQDSLVFSLLGYHPKAVSIANLPTG